jgi:hypothetical protein
MGERRLAQVESNPAIHVINHGRIAGLRSPCASLPITRKQPGKR